MEMGSGNRAEAVQTQEKGLFRTPEECYQRRLETVEKHQLPGEI